MDFAFRNTNELENFLMKVVLVNFTFCAIILNQMCLLIRNLHLHHYCQSQNLIIYQEHTR